MEAERAVLEVEAFISGTLLRILVPDGETVPVGATLGIIGEPGEAV